MLCTIYYAIHNTVYIIVVHHGILNDIYINKPWYILQHLLFIHLQQHPCPQHSPRCRALLDEVFVATSTSELDWVHLGTIGTRGGELAAAEHPHVLG